jgi:hypothetical protein
MEESCAVCAMHSGACHERLGWGNLLVELDGPMAAFQLRYPLPYCRIHMRHPKGGDVAKDGDVYCDEKMICT